MNYDVDMTFSSPTPSGVQAVTKLPAAARVVVSADNAAEAVQAATRFLEQSLKDNGGIGHDIFLRTVSAVPRKIEPYETAPYVSKLEGY